MGMTKAQRNDLDNTLLEASLEVSGGESWFNVLRKRNLSHHRIKKNLHRLPELAALALDAGAKRTLEQITQDPSGLFLVPEKYLKEDYNRVLSSKQQRLDSGAYNHLYNREF